MPGLQRFGKYFRVFDVFVDHLISKLPDGHPLIAGLEPPEFFRLVQTVNEDEPFFAKGFKQGRQQFVAKGVLEPALSITPPAAAPPDRASGAFRSVAHPQRTGEYASGALGRETPHLHSLTTPRDERVVHKPG